MMTKTQERVLDDIECIIKVLEALAANFLKTGLAKEEEIRKSYGAIVNVLNTEVPNAVVALAACLADLLDGMKDQYLEHIKDAKKKESQIN